MKDDFEVVEDAGYLISRYSAFAIDLDGVVWRGEKVIEGAIEGLNAIRRAGKPLLLLTNNGGYLPQEVVERLAEHGFDLRPEELLTTSLVAVQWIKDHELVGAPAFVLAPSTVAAQLGKVVNVRYIEAGQQASIVIVGRDIDLSYTRLAVACDAIRSGAAFLSLNKDPVMPVENGAMVPGTGSIVAAVEAASGKVATVLGKPELPMMQAAAHRLGTGDVLMIGDRLESDIAGARAIGWDAALVLTGLSGKGTAMEPKPDYVISGLGALARPAGAGTQTP